MALPARVQTSQHLEASGLQYILGNVQMWSRESIGGGRCPKNRLTKKFGKSTIRMNATSAKKWKKVTRNIENKCGKTRPRSQHTPAQWCCYGRRQTQTWVTLTKDSGRQEGHRLSEDPEWETANADNSVNLFLLCRMVVKGSTKVF